MRIVPRPGIGRARETHRWVLGEGGPGAGEVSADGCFGGGVGVTAGGGRRLPDGVQFRAVPGAAGRVEGQAEVGEVGEVAVAPCGDAVGGAGEGGVGGGAAEGREVVDGPVESGEVDPGLCAELLEEAGFVVVVAGEIGPSGELAGGGASGVVGEDELVVDCGAELAEEGGDTRWRGGRVEDLLEWLGAHACYCGGDSGGGPSAVKLLGCVEPVCRVVWWCWVAEGGSRSGFGDETVDDRVACPGVIVVVDRGSCSCW